MTRLDRRRDLAGYLEHFRARVIQDALTEATSRYWLHRAATWEWVIHGGPPPPANGPTTTYRPAEPKPRAEWTARDFERQAIADACRNKASVALIQTDPDQPSQIDPDLWQVLADIANDAATEARCEHCQHCTRHADQSRRAA